MAKKVATSKQTSGGGFNFEDKVTAWFLVDLLNHNYPISSLSAIIHKIEFQTKADGWHLDDLLLRLKSISNEDINIPCTIKSNVHFSGNGPNESMNRDLWEQFLNHETDTFNPEIDYLGVVNPTMTSALSTNINKLLSAARDSEPNKLQKRIEKGKYGGFSEFQIKVFNGFKCPSDLAKIYSIGDEDTWKFLSRILFLEFDFENTISKDYSALITKCKNSLVSSDNIQETLLCTKLCEIRKLLASSEGASINYQQLLGRIRNLFKLKGIKNQAGDWLKIENSGRSKLESIRDTIGGKVSINLEDEITSLETLFLEHQVIFLLGDSGFGKSVLSKKLALRSDSKFIWIDPSSIESGDLTKHFNLDNPIIELIEFSQDESPKLFIDGIDRFFGSHQIGVLRDILATASKENSGWKVLVSCQTDDYDNTIQNLYNENLEIKHHVHAVAPIGIKNSSQIKAAFPSLDELFNHEHLSRVLNNLKYLDLLAYHAPQNESTELFDTFGESTIIDWIWEEEIQKSKNGNGDQRSIFLQSIASDQAETLKSGISKFQYEISQLSPLPSLKRDKLIYELEDKLFFSHDLFGDWARYKLIRSKRDELKSFLLSKNLVSPLWGKAIRLYAMSLLEKTESNELWKQIVSSLNQNEPREKIIQDLFFEAILFSSSSETILESLWSFFKSDNGDYLRQFLSRFLIKGTRPNERVLQIASEIGGYSIAEVSTINRIPHYLYWPPILSFLRNHVDEIIEISRENLAVIAEKWLTYTPALIPYREEAAWCAFKNAESMFNFKLNSGSWISDDVDEIIYKAMLTGLHEFPNEIKELSLKLARRLQFDRPEKELQNKSSIPNSLWNPPIVRGAIQWEHGPFERVDEAFSNVCLYSDSINSMILAYPETAREIILALLIDEPTPISNDDSYNYKFEINDLRKWDPPFYSNGPILYFLNHNSEIGISLVLNLINFATQQWIQAYERRQEAAPSITINFEGKDKIFFGDERVYFWYRNVWNPPTPIPTVLMALEKFLMVQLDNGVSISQLIQEIFEKSTSVAIIGVLSSLARYKNDLYKNDLKPLLSCYNLYDWEKALDDDRNDIERFQMFGTAGIGKEKWEEIQAWNNLEHRKVSIGRIAHSLYLNSSDLDDFYVEWTTKWNDDMSVYEKDGIIDVFRTHLIAQFNKNNYELVPFEGGAYFQYIEPQEVTEKLSSLRRDIDRTTNTFFLPFRYSRDIEENKKYSISEIEQLYDHVLNFEYEDDQETTKYGILFGGLALVINNRDVWQAIHPEYDEIILKFVEEALRNTHAQINQLDISETSNSWRSFCAVILTNYWIEKPSDKRIRNLLGVLLLKSSYDVIEKVFQNVSKKYNWADPQFIQLQNLIIKWSSGVYRHYVEPRDQDEISDDDQGFWQKLLARFKGAKKSTQKYNVFNFADSIIKEFISDEKTANSLLSWADTRIDISKRNRYSWHSQKINMGHESGVLTEMIHHTFSSIPTLTNCRDEKEYEYVLQFWSYTLEQVVFEIGNIEEGKDIYDEYPQNFNYWVIKGIAKLISEMEIKDNSHPEKYWKPIFDYGYFAPHFVENLVSWFYIECLEDQSKYQRFHQEWVKMYDYAIQSENWKFNGRFRTYEVWETLIGITNSQLRYWNDDFRSFLGPISDRILNYFEDNVSNQDTINGLINLLRKRSGETLIMSGISIIEKHLELQIFVAKTETPEGYVRREFKYIESLAKTMSYLWENYSTIIISNEEAFECFKKIILYLVSKQNAIGIELQLRIIQ